MGIIAALNYAEGKDNITMKLLLLTVFATVGLAVAESEAEAKPGLAYLPYGYYGYVPLVYTLGGVAAHPGAATSWTQRSAQGAAGRRSRSAEAPVFPGIDAVFGHPHHSAVGTTTWGFPKTKRSAEPEPNPGFLYHPYVYALPVVKPIVHAFPASEGEGVAAHPNDATATIGTTTWGFQ